MTPELMGGRPAVQRVLGVYEGRRPGRTVIALGGMHGDEPASVRAVQAVLAELRRRELELAGTVVGVVGNRQAFAAERRYVARDLNRGWTSQSCRRVLHPRDGESAEDVEQRELLELFGPLEGQSPHPLVFLDLHSTSGPAAPFCIIPDVARNRDLAIPLPIPTLLGLEEILDNPMLGYLTDRGHMGVAVEGGQHDDPETQARLEAVIWLSLLTMRCLRPEQVPRRRDYQAALRRACTGLPHAVRIVHRHGLGHDEGFVMEPGFENFHRVRRGQRLARDAHGPIEATFDGLVMLPRYQSQGDDGFFLATTVTRRWLALSAAARRGRMEHLLALWPGLRRDAGNPNRLRYAGTE
ncbi:MAG: succinylglutamate desuccinylase/aspartoacylase family protein, partial [Myxococcales bacterium]|nr:succinylglutamate desuccinylase/aspartoacylase family protein [Myxococcales bacterium]